LNNDGYIQQNREEMEVLFTLLAQRYERGGVTITSNLPFSQWERIFKDPTTTAAAVDRLVHHSVIIELNLESYRLTECKEQKTEAGDASATTTHKKAHSNRPTTTENLKNSSIAPHTPPNKGTINREL
jgi:IstB-like ATP binding protein